MATPTGKRVRSASAGTSRTAKPTAGNAAPTRRRARTASAAAAQTAEPAADSAALTCPECGRSFSRPAALGAHRSRVHGVPGSSQNAPNRRNRATAQPRRTRTQTVTRTNNGANAHRSEPRSAGASRRAPILEPSSLPGHYARLVTASTARRPRPTRRRYGGRSHLRDRHGLTDLLRSMANATRRGMTLRPVSGKSSAAPVFSRRSSRC
jgi:hypothetical protein